MQSSETAAVRDNTLDFWEPWSGLHADRCELQACPHGQCLCGRCYRGKVPPKHSMRGYLRLRRSSCARRPRGPLSGLEREAEACAPAQQTSAPGRAAWPAAPAPAPARGRAVTAQDVKARATNQPCGPAPAASWPLLGGGPEERRPGDGRALVTPRASPANSGPSTHPGASAGGPQGAPRGAGGAGGGHDRRAVRTGCLVARASSAGGRQAVASEGTGDGEQAGRARPPWLGHAGSVAGQPVVFRQVSCTGALRPRLAPALPPAPAAAWRPGRVGREDA
eukprot:scaffold4372_cov397-Prasinococcus_capsulatus_cf.AAC.40